MRDVLEQLVQPVLPLGPLVMGVLNTTPDSFSDGGKYLAPEDAARHVAQLIADGADIIDIGAESSKPQSAPVSAEEQLARLTPALRYALSQNCCVSVDTTAPGVASFALKLGARIVNDVSCLRDPDLARVTADHDAWLVITHCRRPMAQMEGFSQWPDDDYADIVADVRRDWELAAERAVQAGMAEGRLIFDPGFGYSKNARQCFEVLGRLSEFTSIGAPILSGPGRKSFIADIDRSPPQERLGGTVAASLLSAQAGAHIVRVHDVKEVRQALEVWLRQRARN